MDDEKAQTEALSSLILEIFQLCAFISLPSNLEYLKRSLELFEENLRGYEAIGIIEVSSYSDKCKRGESEIKRLKALINLVEVLVETNSFIDVEPPNLNETIGKWKE